MNLTGIRYGAEIASAAAAHNLDPTLLAAVAAQETGGPGRNSGRNVVGDGGHGRGLFQIDDRSWAFASTPAAMDPAKNADMAATILQANLQRYGGNVTQALSAYNTGNPGATGTLTTWGDGTTLGYAHSVMRHYDDIVAQEQGQAVADNRETAGDVNALAAASSALPVAGAPGLSCTASASPAASSSAMPASASSGSSASSTSISSALSAAMASMPALQQPAAPTPVPAIPQGSQAQAASSVGAQADHDEANLVDQGDVYDGSSDDA